MKKKDKWIIEYRKEQTRGWNAFEALPIWIRVELQNAHQHTILHKDIEDEIVYREVDVVDIINKILNKENEK
jgi:hypothetical protein